MKPRLADPVPQTARSYEVTGATVIEVLGEVDMATSPRLADALERSGQSSPLVVVDLSGVTFLDSTGLFTLVRGQRELKQREIDLRLVGLANPIVRRVFELSDLIGRLALVDSLEEALPSPAGRA